MHEWRFCLKCAAMDADRICIKCYGCDNCCVCNGELVHRQSNVGAFTRRKARQQHEEKSKAGDRARQALPAAQDVTSHDSHADGHSEGSGPHTPKRDG